MQFEDHRVVAIVPCFNEEATVGQVVADLKKAVPGIAVYVYDNMSTDATAIRALEAGAIVRREMAKGKGNVVRRAFADLDADIYLLIDGDDTYEAADAPNMIDILVSGPFDHVVGVRRPCDPRQAYRAGHEAGNRMMNWIVSKAFGEDVDDMLSGFRAFSRRFVKTFPAMSRGFEIETELTVHSLRMRVARAEVPVGFRQRPTGSESKLHTVRDGLRILALIARLTRHERPLRFFGLLGTVSMLIGVGLGASVAQEFLASSVVLRVPTLTLALTLCVLGTLFWTAGLVLDGIRQSRYEHARLAYLAIAAPPVDPISEEAIEVAAGASLFGDSATRTQRDPSPVRKRALAAPGTDAA